MTYNAIDLADTISSQISNGTYALKTGHYDEAATLIERMNEDLSTFRLKYALEHAGVFSLLCDAADRFTGLMREARDKATADERIARQYTIGKVHLDEPTPRYPLIEQAVNVAQSYWDDDKETMDLSVDDVIVSEDRHDFTVTLIHHAA